MGNFLSKAIPREVQQKASDLSRECWKLLKTIYNTLRPCVSWALRVLGARGLVFFRFWGYIFRLLGSWHYKGLDLFQSWTSGRLTPQTSKRIFMALEVVVGASLILYINGPSWVLVDLPLWLWEQLKECVRLPIPTLGTHGGLASMYKDEFIGPILHFMITKLALPSFVFWTTVFAKARKTREQEEAHAARRGPEWKPVYISQYATFGGINHKILIVDGRKYELRLPDPDQLAIYRTNSCPVNHKNRTRAREEGEASKDEYYIYLIGWTRQTHDQIHAVCREKIEGWNYHPTLHNCLDFLKAVSDLVVEDKTAADWEYFRHGKKSSYQHYLFTRPKANLPLKTVDAFLRLGLPVYGGFRLWLQE